MQWLAEICVHRPVFATVIVLFLTVVGGFSFFTLGVDRFPKIDLPTITVSTTNTGAAPAEIETEITDPVEGVLNTVPGIDEMRSSSSQGRSNITLTFNLEKDPDQAYQEVQQKLSTVINRLPETADPPPGPSLFVAIQQQLGLRLEARKGPVEVLVVDSASRTPAEN